MKLKSITFVFENCDALTIPGECVGDFVASDITSDICRRACNDISRIDVCRNFFIEISKNANGAHNELSSEKWTTTKFSRLRQYGDITSIKFDLEEDSQTEHYSYYLDWTGDSEYTNKAQKTYESELGNLYVIVADGKKLEDYVDINQINDKDYVDMKFDMYNIGRGNL